MAARSKRASRRSNRRKVAGRAKTEASKRIAAGDKTEKKKAEPARKPKKVKHPPGDRGVMPLTLVYAFAFLLFGMIALALYWPSFEAPMYYDSKIIEANQYNLQTGGFWKALEIVPLRPIPMASFYLNHVLWGMSPVHFRLVNVGLLVLVALSVTFLVHAVLQSPAAERRGNESLKLGLSVFLGLVYLLHPLQVFVTAYVWQRMSLLASLFYFLSVAVYVRVRSRESSGGRLGYTLSAALFLGAMLCKESSVTLPAVLILAEVALFRSSWKEVLKRAAIFAGCVILLLGLLTLRENPHGFSQVDPENLAESAPQIAQPDSGIFSTIVSYYRGSGKTFFEAVLTHCRMLLSSIGVIALPVPAYNHLIVPQVISSSLVEPLSTLPAVLGALLFIGLGLYALRARPLTGLGILFFAGGLAPDALLVPQFAYFAYRPALSMCGLLIVAADWLLLLHHKIAPMLRRGWVRWSAVASLAIVAAALGASTFVKARQWGEPLLFWEETVDRFPDPKSRFEKNVAAHILNQLGMEHMSRGNHAESVDYLQKAGEYSPNHPSILNNLGIALCKVGRIEEGMRRFERALDIFPGNNEAKRNLAFARRLIDERDSRTGSRRK